MVTQLAERAEGAEAEVKTLAEKTLGCGEDGEIIRDFHGDVGRKKWGDNPMKTYENPFSMGYIYIYCNVM